MQKKIGRRQPWASLHTPRLFLLAGCVGLAWGCEVSPLDRFLFGWRAVDVPTECLESADCPSERPICVLTPPCPSDQPDCPQVKHCQPCVSSGQCFERAEQTGSHTGVDACLIAARGGQQAGQCGPCQSDSECASGVCVTEEQKPLFAPMTSTGGVFSVGDCVPEKAIAFVRYSAGPACGTGTQADPYCSVGQALASPALQSASYIVLRLLPALRSAGVQPVHPPIAFSRPGALLLLDGQPGSDGELPAVASVSVSGQAQLFVDRVALVVPRPQGVPAVLQKAAYCGSQAKLFVRRSTVRPEYDASAGIFLDGSGIDSEASCARLVVERSFLYGVRDFGIRAQAADVRIVNNGLVRIQGSANATARTGAIVLGAPMGLAAFNTVVRNPNTVACADNNQARFVGNLVTENNGNALVQNGCATAAQDNYITPTLAGQPFALPSELDAPASVLLSRLVLYRNAAYSSCCLEKITPAAGDLLTDDYFGCQRPSASQPADYGFHQHNGTNCKP